MADLLSSASLLLALVGLLYSLWYPEMKSAAQTEVPQQEEDREAPRDYVSRVLFRRALPLSLAATGLAIIFVPDTFGIVYGAVSTAYQLGFSALRAYSAVKAAFCFVVAFAIAISGHLLTLTARLYMVRRKLT